MINFRKLQRHSQHHLHDKNFAKDNGQKSDQNDSKMDADLNWRMQVKKTRNEAAASDEPPRLKTNKLKVKNFPFGTSKTYAFGKDGTS